ncbi:hypothetical protein QTP88_029462 [Uroleucon formosanum]
MESGGGASLCDGCSGADVCILENTGKKKRWAGDDAAKKSDVQILCTFGDFRLSAGELGKKNSRQRFRLTILAETRRLRDFGTTRGSKSNNDLTAGTSNFIHL